jgi:hypothetical protein
VGAAALLLPCLIGAAAATERSTSMAVSVEVVDPCTASTGPEGLASVTCSSRSGGPVAVVSRAGGFTPAAADGAPVAIDAAVDAEGLVTVYY